MQTRCVAPTAELHCHDSVFGLCGTAGPPLKSAAGQRRGGYGSILHYIYQSTLGQSLHSQMRQVRLQGSCTDGASFCASVQAYVHHLYYVET